MALFIVVVTGCGKPTDDSAKKETDLWYSQLSTDSAGYATTIAALKKCPDKSTDDFVTTACQNLSAENLKEFISVFAEYQNNFQSAIDYWYSNGGDDMELSKIDAWEGAMHQNLFTFQSQMPTEPDDAFRLWLLRYQNAP